MLVIEGKAGKSKILYEKLKEWNKDQTLIIDTVGIVHIFGISCDVMSYLDLEELENEFLYDKYKRLIFEINCQKDYMFHIWKLEQKLMKKYSFRECVVTIQTEDDEIKVYEV